jgi:hypothetical protein
VQNNLTVSELLSYFLILKLWITYLYCVHRWKYTLFRDNNFSLCFFIWFPRLVPVNFFVLGFLFRHFLHNGYFICFCFFLFLLSIFMSSFSFFSFPESILLCLLTHQHSTAFEIVKIETNFIWFLELPILLISIRKVCCIYLHDFPLFTHLENQPFWICCSAYDPKIY